jgi:DnaJ domain
MSLEGRRWFEVLGIAPDASAKEAEDAHDKLRKRFHPDLNPDDPEGAGERFKEVEVAYREYEAKVEADTKASKRQRVKEQKRKEAAASDDFAAAFGDAIRGTPKPPKPPPRPSPPPKPSSAGTARPPSQSGPPHPTSPKRSTSHPLTIAMSTITIAAGAIWIVSSLGGSSGESPSKSDRVEIPKLGQLPPPKPILPRRTADRFGVTLTWVPAPEARGERSGILHVPSPGIPGWMTAAFNSYSTGYLLNVKISIRFDQVSTETAGGQFPTLAESVENTCLDIRHERTLLGQARLVAPDLHQNGNAMTGSMSFSAVIPGEYWLDFGCESGLEAGTVQYLGQLQPGAEEMIEDFDDSTSVAILKMDSSATQTAVLYAATWSLEKEDRGEEEINAYDGVLPSELCLTDREELEYFGDEGWHFSRRTAYHREEGVNGAYELGSFVFPVGTQELSDPVFAVNHKDLPC